MRGKKIGLLGKISQRQLNRYRNNTSRTRHRTMAD